MFAATLCLIGSDVSSYFFLEVKLFLGFKSRVCFLKQTGVSGPLHVPWSRLKLLFFSVHSATQQVIEIGTLETAYLNSM